MRYYDAPWSKLLIGVSLFTTVTCVGVAVGAAWEAAARSHLGLLRWLTVLPLLILLGAALCTIRGYSIGTEVILVHRLLWATPLPRTGLESVTFEPDAMRGSLRTFGNGGAFSFSGLYYNRRLGSYRAFVTDQHRTVVLRYATRRVVLSPAAPEDFVADLALTDSQGSKART
jgi:hypothetical protein